MSYDKKDRVVYTLGVIDFGAGADVTRTLPVPPGKGGVGKSGRVAHVLIGPVTEDFAGSTSDAGVRLGDGTDADKYFDSGLATLDETVDVADNAILRLVDDGAAAEIEPGRSTITFTGVVSAGTPTGQAEVSIAVDYYD
jgi:hypothetical protein